MQCKQQREIDSKAVADQRIADSNRVDSKFEAMLATFDKNMTQFSTNLTSSIAQAVPQLSHLTTASLISGSAAGSGSVGVAGVLGDGTALPVGSVLPDQTAGSATTQAGALNS